MEICPHCGREFKDRRALDIHITIAHVAYKVADIQAQLEKQREFNDLVLAILRKQIEEYTAIKARLKKVEIALGDGFHDIKEILYQRKE